MPLDFEPQLSLEGAEDALKPRRLAEGWYQFVISEADLSAKETTGNVSLTFKAAPLKVVDDVNSASQMSIKNWTMWPIVNPNWRDDQGNGHTIPSMAWKTSNQLLSATTGFATSPKYDKDAREHVYNGASVGDGDDARKEHSRLLGARALEVAQDPSILDGSTFYGKVVENGPYMNLKVITGSLPDDAVLVEL